VAFGDYPASMRQRLGARLPTFTPDEQALLKGCMRAAGS
jgi:beta-glucosidase